MADSSGGRDVYRAKDLELLQSGNYADVKVVCGDRSWNCHRAILTSRSIWFQKALAGPFQEASTGQVNLNEENPTCVDLALKYIYGGEFDVVSFIPDDHFIEHCVSLWRTADFLLLNKLKSPVEKAVHSYCDKKMKQICTYGSPPTWSNLFNRKKLTPWALDVVLGLRCTYKWNIEHLKAVLMEFIWIARTWVLTPILISTLNDHFKDVPAFKDDLLCKYASASWNKTAVWAPRITNDITTDGGRFRGLKKEKDALWTPSR